MGGTARRVGGNRLRAGFTVFFVCSYSDEKQSATRTNALPSSGLGGNEPNWLNFFYCTQFAINFTNRDLAPGLIMQSKFKAAARRLAPFCYQSGKIPD